MATRQSDLSALQRDTARRTRKGTLPENHPELHYIGGLDDHYRITLILRYAHQVHRFSVSDLIRHLVATPMVGSTGGLSRVDRFNQALQQPQVIDKIEFPPLLRSIDIYGMLISELRSEIQTVAGEPLFNKYNKDTSPMDMDIQHAGSHIRTHAPLLTRLFEGLTASYTDNRRTKQGERDGPLLMIFIIIAYASGRKSFNNFTTLLGLYANSHGAKRRLLNMLHHLGITPSWDTILERHREISQHGRVMLIYSLYPCFLINHCHLIIRTRSSNNPRITEIGLL